MKRISLSSNGVQANDDSIRSDLSADGRFVAFDSYASNLVAGDTNQKIDVFVHDLATGITTRVSVGANGQQGNDESARGSISADGRFVAFTSAASNLVLGDTNKAADVFVRDRLTGTTSRVSVASNGAQSNNHSNYLVRPEISGTGRFVVFPTFATNLVPGDTNGTGDVFVHDRQTKSTTRASVTSAGVQGNLESLNAVISDNGRFVAFASLASNLVSNDGNSWTDVFLRDRLAGTTTRVTVNTGGIQGHLGGYSPVITPDGRYVGFTSQSSNLAPNDLNGLNDVFIRDLVTGVTELASLGSSGRQGTNASSQIALSADGRFAAFGSDCHDLVPVDTNAATDIFVRDRHSGATTRASVSTGGIEGNAPSAAYAAVALSADGSVLVFVSDASNLAPSDTNGATDVFVHVRAPATPTIFCNAKINSQGCTPEIKTSGTPSASLTSHFDIACVRVLNHKRGLLFYALGPNQIPFHGGTLCTAAPIARTPVQDSAGNSPPDDCSGGLSVDFNARIRSGVDPRLVPGSVIYAQYVHEDPASPGSLGLTNAVVFTIQP